MGVLAGLSVLCAFADLPFPPEDPRTPEEVAKALNNDVDASVQDARDLGNSIKDLDAKYTQNFGDPLPENQFADIKAPNVRVMSVSERAFNSELRDATHSAADASDAFR